MKNKQKAALRLLAALLALTLLAPLGLTASAADDPDTIYIDSASDFVSFAKRCALDTWSAGKTVILRTDISLAGMDYTPVAAFGGTFDGGGHTISDLNLTGSYSPAGLFAVILSGGSVEDLNVAGSVAAAGDKIVAGGIAGENYGRIVCCSFTGMVQGSAQIGGIAGVNRVSGQIISSTFDGKVQATNATGGIAGLNEGIIRHCTNTGSINTNNVDASLSLSDIQIDTTLDLANLTTSQTFLTTTETGGIAGSNTGLIAGCKNTGTVGYEHVGYNIGGIAGAMGLEYSVDPESDVSQSLSSSERKQYELRALLQSCVSTGAVTAKKDCAAAICGRMDLGLAEGCEAYGSVESQSGDYVGGVAGICSAAIENCCAKCELSGGRYLGGIVGSGVTDSVTGGGSTVSGCTALVRIGAYEQYAGAIAGSDAGAFAQNRFVSDALAGLNGRSVAGAAEPIAYRTLMEDETLPDAFRTFTVQFVADGNVLKTVEVNYGESLDESAYPDIPAVDGQYGVWDPPTLNSITFDTTVTAEYHTCVDALPSDAQRDDGRPVFLAEGAFSDTDRLQAQPQAITPTAFGEISASVPEAIRKYFQNISDGHAPAAHVAKSVIEQWQLRLPEDGDDTHTIRFRVPDGQKGTPDIYLMNASGVWQKAKTTEIGSYLSFEASGQTVQMAALSTFPVWWVWIVLAGLTALLVLLIIHLIHKLGKTRRRQMQALRKAMQDEQNANDAAIGGLEADAQPAPLTPEQAKKRKSRRRVWLIVLLVLAAALTAGVLIYRANLKSSVDALLLLKNLSARKELDMDASVQMDLGDETLQTDAHLFRTQADGKTILCIEENGVRLYYYDGSIYLENGSAYRTSGLFPDYSTLGEHLLELYNATDVTYARESGEEVYSVTAYGEDAAQALSLLTPTIADSLSAVDSIDLCMHVQDGEIRSIEASGSCEAQDAGGVTQPMNVWAELTIQPDVQTPHSVPQAVTDAMAGGGYQGKLELTEDLLRVISAVSELGKRDPLAARVGLTANCGPVIFNTSLDYFRTTENGRSVSGIRAGSVELWFTGEKVLTKDGKTASASEQALTKCADLLDIAYRACLEGGVTSTQTENGYTYTLTLSADRTRQAACAIAPDAEKLNVEYQPGTISLDVQDGKVTALRVELGGSVQVAAVDTQVSLAAQFTFRSDLTAEDVRVPAAALEKL